jgi:hypothetical protein
MSLPILLMLLFIWAMIGIAMGFLAMRKGYTFAAWFLTGGFVLLGAIALGFMPNAKDPTRSPAERDRMRTRGNQIGLILSIVTLVLGFLSFGLQLVVADITHMREAHNTSYALFRLFSKLLNWLQMFFFAMVLVLYLTKPGRQRSVFVVLPLVLLMVDQLGFVVLSLTENAVVNNRSEVMMNLRMLMHFGLQMMNVVAMAILGIGLLLLQPKTPTPVSEKPWTGPTR